MRGEFRGFRYERSGMMNWGGFDRFENKIGNQDGKTVSDGVTVNVVKPIIPTQ